MVAHDVLDDARYAHASPSEDADDTIKTVSYIGTDEDWLAVVNPWNLEEGLLILLQCRLALLATDALLPSFIKVPFVDTILILALKDNPTMFILLV